MSLPKEGSRETDEGIIVSVPCDWCRSPTAIIPYKIWARQKEAGNLANSVRQTSLRSHVKDSLVLKCHGDEAGTGGGVASGTHGAECTPKTWSATVRAEGRNMVRHTDEWWMNHKNTWGKLNYPKDMSQYSTAPTHKIVPRMGPVPKDAEKYQAFSTKTPQEVEEELEEDTNPIQRLQAPNSDFNTAKQHAIMGAGAAIAIEIEIERGTFFKTPPPEPPNNVRVSGQPCRCNQIVGSYSKISKSCKLLCGAKSQAHHFWGDKHFRFSNAAQATNPAFRIQAPTGSASLPTHADGPAICLEGNARTKGTEHNTGHANDGLISKLGSKNPTPNALDFFMVTSLTTQAAINARPDCREEIIRQSEAAAEGISPDAPLRTTNGLPKPDSPAFRTFNPGPGGQ